MQSSTETTRDTYLAARWLSLAERRLSYLTEMLVSGRWRRYHTEANMQTAIRETTSAIEVWKRLVPQDNSLTVPASIAAILPPSPFQSAAFSPAETDTAVAAG